MNWEREGSRDGIQESTGFNKNVKKSGPLIIGDKEQVLSIIIAFTLLFHCYNYNYSVARQGDWLP
jgi:hypothetical protein